MSSNIVVRVRYNRTKNLKQAILKWNKYASDPSKSDSDDLNKDNALFDYYQYDYNRTDLIYNGECGTWNMYGNIDVRNDVDYQENLKRSGIFWDAVISFENDFAVKNHLITKKDFYDLTTNVMPKFLNDAGFNFSNVVWYGTLHRNTGHLHMHLSFFEKKQTSDKAIIPSSSIKYLKSNIINYLVDNQHFYQLKDQMLSNILSKIDVQDYLRYKKLMLNKTSYLKQLNEKLISFYQKLPKTGRLQYYAKNIDFIRDELDSIIELILSSENIRDQYNQYLVLLDQHQKQLIDYYGNSQDNKNQKYFNNQKNKLYSQIGNKILKYFREYNRQDLKKKEIEFLKHHLKNLKLKSPSNYKSEETYKKIGNDLIALCKYLSLDRVTTTLIINSWQTRSKIKVDLNHNLRGKKDLTVDEIYIILKRLGYDFNRYSKIKKKYFLQALNYQNMIYSSVCHLEYEIERERNKIINDLEYELEGNKEY